VPDVAVTTLIFLLYVALLIIGIGRILIGALAKHLPVGIRILSIIAGLILIGLSIAVLAYQYPYFATDLMIAMFAFALLMYGISSITIGGFSKILPNWVRGLFVAEGIFAIIISIVVLVVPDIAILTLVFLLSFALVWNGIIAIVSGVTGKP
jgi:uncharacterized membrane protein HdeD (DUF308 family)